VTAPAAAPAGGWTAIVRPPGERFAAAISSHPDRVLIDPARARAEHTAYCRLLEEAGGRVLALPADEAHPDGCFTQDTAVVLPSAGGPRALLARFGAAERLGEERQVAPVLAPLVASISAVAAPATLEGGDVLVGDGWIAVGRSRRTNEPGIAALAAFAAPLGYDVVPVDIPAWALHLSTAATLVGSGLVIGAAEVLAQPHFRNLDRIAVPDDQRFACNVWACDRFVIAAGSWPVHRELERRGIEVRPTDLTEFNRADGSPTCLSLVVSATTGRSPEPPAPGGPGPVAAEPGGSGPVGA
jgi:dimethylargininase